MHNRIVDSALWWLSKGASLIPLQPKTKQIVRGFGPHQRKITNPLEAREWFLGRGCNLAVVVPDGLICLDFDVAEVYGPWRLGEGQDVRTVIEKTRRGWHVWGLDNFPVEFPPVQGVEFKRGGAVVTVAPSVVGEFRYQLCTDHPFASLPHSTLCSLSPTKHPPAGRKADILTGAAFGPERSLITQIKAAVCVLDIASEMTTLRQTQSGRYWVGKCPFHDDHDQHFWADSDRGLCGCHFAGCRFAGAHDVVNLAAVWNGISLREAVRLLASEVTL